MMIGHLFPLFYAGKALKNSTIQQKNNLLSHIITEDCLC